MPIKLIAPPHTPMTAEGVLNLDIVDRQARHLAESGVSAVFVAGSTGEGQSLSIDERKSLTQRWVDVAGEHQLEVIAQVGSNAQPNSIQLASHAAECGAQAIAALAPCYFKPTSVDALIDFFAPVCEAAGEIPFYFYDIPGMTGVSLSTVDFLRRAQSRLTNLAGVKFTNPDLMLLQECLRLDDGRFEIWFGCDEALLAGYELGIQGAVGSTYNFAAPLYHAMISACDRGDHDAARELQAKSVELIRICQSFGYPAAAKSAMSIFGIDCGPVRSPLQNLTSEQHRDLHRQLEPMNLNVGRSVR